MVSKWLHSHCFRCEKNVVLSKDSDGFTVINNSKGISHITITWNYTYFYIGWMITILSVILLAYILKMPSENTINKNQLDEKCEKRIKKRSGKETNHIHLQK